MAAATSISQENQCCYVLSQNVVHRIVASIAGLQQHFLNYSCQGCGLPAMQGSFGKVYRGKLGGKTLAVKVRRCPATI